MHAWDPDTGTWITDHDKIAYFIGDDKQTIYRRNVTNPGTGDVLWAFGATPEYTAVIVGQLNRCAR